jgi:hypothetical protein
VDSSVHPRLHIQGIFAQNSSGQKIVFMETLLHRKANPDAFSRAQFTKLRYKLKGPENRNISEQLNWNLI